jgi:ribosomal protein S19
LWGGFLIPNENLENFPRPAIPEEAESDLKFAELRRTLSIIPTGAVRGRNLKMLCRKALGGVRERGKDQMANFVFKKLKNRLKQTKTIRRDEILEPWMLGSRFKVYDGKNFVLVEVVRLRLGKRAGEFVFTRKPPVHKKKKRK